MRVALAEHRYPASIVIPAHHGLWPRLQQGLIGELMGDKTVVDGIQVDEIGFREKTHDFLIEFSVPSLLKETEETYDFLVSSSVPSYIDE